MMITVWFFLGVIAATAIILKVVEIEQRKIDAQPPCLACADINRIHKDAADAEAWTEYVLTRSGHWDRKDDGLGWPLLHACQSCWVELITF